MEARIAKLEQEKQALEATIATFEKEKKDLEQRVTELEKQKSDAEQKATDVTTQHNNLKVCSSLAFTPIQLSIYIYVILTDGSLSLSD